MDDSVEDFFKPMLSISSSSLDSATFSSNSTWWLKVEVDRTCYSSTSINPKIFTKTVPYIIKGGHWTLCFITSFTSISKLDAWSISIEWEVE